MLHAFGVVRKHASFVVLMRAIILPLLIVRPWDFARLWLPPVSHTFIFPRTRPTTERSHSFYFAESLAENDGCSLAPTTRRNFICFPDFSYLIK